MNIRIDMRNAKIIKFTSRTNLVTKADLRRAGFKIEQQPEVNDEQ